MAEIWYACFATTEAVHMHELPPVSTPEDHQQRSDLIGELRGQYGIPEDWVTHQDREANGWDVSITVMSARVTLHPLGAS